MPANETAVPENSLPETGEGAHSAPQIPSETPGGTPEPTGHALPYSRVRYRFRAKFTMGEMFLYFLVWLLLTLVTLGIALFFAPYA